ncbi:MAG: hypothetical protein KAI64_05705, partial [Thermoplasmata archaeon]|nr:hypothetical protein [Thermoplasmata archaeon]
MKKRFLTNLVLISTLIIFSLSPFLLGQGQDEGYVSVQGDTEMIGAGSISGGGHVTWVFTGDQAKELRRYILQMFDNSTLPCYFVAAKILAPTSCPFVGPVPNGNL